MRGAKWMREASYLTAADKKAILAEVEHCRAYCRLMQSGHNAVMPHPKSWYNPVLVRVRPAIYTGSPHPIATVTYGYGGSMIWSCVYRQDDPIAHYVTEDNTH